jgi:hypothetical protein
VINYWSGCHMSKPAKIAKRPFLGSAHQGTISITTAGWDAHILTHQDLHCHCWSRCARIYNAIVGQDAKYPNPPKSPLSLSVGMPNIPTHLDRQKTLPWVLTQQGTTDLASSIQLTKHNDSTSTEPQGQRVKTYTMRWSLQHQRSQLGNRQPTLIALSIEG